MTAALCVFLAWQYWPSDERAIRGRLQALAADLNGSSGPGGAALVRAAHLGDYFADDVVVELGEGSAPIIGRSTVMGMAARLERRTSDARLRFEDVGIRVQDSGTEAGVSLTAIFLREDGSGGTAADAREFALQMVKAAGKWRIARATAVMALR